MLYVLPHNGAYALLKFGGLAVLAKLYSHARPFAVGMAEANRFNKPGMLIA
jgi:hypothetical protein